MSVSRTAELSNSYSGSSSSPQTNGLGLVHRSSSMGKPEIVKMNLTAVRRIDDCVTDLISTVPRVILYEYEQAANTWVSCLYLCQAAPCSWVYEMPILA